MPMSFEGSKCIDLPEDPELGISENNRADASGIQPGTQAAQIILDYVNQPLPDNAAGEAFRVELDTELHAYTPGFRDASRT